MSTMEENVPAPIRAAMAQLRRRPISVVDKGFGPLAATRPVDAATLAREGGRLHDSGVGFPMLTLRDSALRHNIAAMADYCARSGVELAPHGKTMMAPQLAARQLAAGAWGITVATVGQLQTYRSFGFSRMLLANELVDVAGIEWLAEERRADPGFSPYCYVDSADGVGILDEVLRRFPAAEPLPVLVELGMPGGRTGARGVSEALAVAARAARATSLRVAGVAGYEGPLGHEPTPQVLGAVAEYCRSLRRLAETLHERGIAEGGQLLSVGGSAFFDVVVAELTSARAGVGDAPTVLLRSGAYLTHDHGFYGGISPAERGAADGLSLRPALELWAPVLSRPEPELALLGAGRRDVSFDEGLPVPLRVRHRDGTESPGDAMSVTALNDQHGYLRVPPGCRVGAGDLVCLGISHPCTTFDKWRVIPVLDDEDRVIDAVHTFF